SCSIPVDLARVQHGVAAATDVDEGGLHAGEHVLHATEVHVADERRLLRLGDVVLDQHAVLQHADLNAVVLLAHDHDAVDALAAREELRLRDDGTTTAGVTAVATALLLGLETRRAAHLLRFIRWLWLLLGLASLAAGGSLLRRPVLGALGFGLLVVTGAATGATAARRGLACDIVGWRRRNHRR